MADPIDEEPPGLARFLSDEVRDRYYADLLIERANAAGQGKHMPGASGDAYYVSFRPDEVVIEHHYREDWQPVHVPREAFVAALQRWKARWA
jgi:hypothetical protein